MDGSNKVQATTNTVANSRKEIHCDCNLMWSIIQQMSTKRLCSQSGRNEGSIIPAYSDRARRIAATYARFYLETEEYGDVSKKGRFYWMALGAFASKTVACSLDDPRVMMIDTVFKGLAKGNLWLFYDISGWHWYYTRFRDSFDQCVSCRDASAYIKPVKDQVANYPWKDDALLKIKNMHEHGYIVSGFALAKKIEAEGRPTQRAAQQLLHLLDIAQHEQGVILQPLIYDDPYFSAWVGRQRAWYANWASPDLELVFNSACDTKEAELKSIAKNTTILESYISRMDWINTAAIQFHDLMQNKTDYMENQLKTISGWVDSSHEPYPYRYYQPI